MNSADIAISFKSRDFSNFEKNVNQIWLIPDWPLVTIHGKSSMITLVDIAEKTSMNLDVSKQNF